MTRPTTAMLMTVCATLACNTKHTRDQGALDAAATGAAPLVLQQVSMLPGTTAVDPTTAFMLFGSPSSPMDLTPLLSLVAQHTGFWMDDGTVLSATAELVSNKPGPAGNFVKISPSTALENDRWYMLVIQEDQDIQIANGRTTADLNLRNPGTWKSDFFTGSAPHVISARRPLGKKDGAYVHITFSEPIQVADLDVQQLFKSGAVSVSQCVLSMGNCAKTTDLGWAEEVDVLPTGPLAQYSDGWQLNLPTTLHGSGRTVQDGANIAGVARLGAVGVANQIVAAASLIQWKACQNGASLCWQAHNQTP